MNLVAVLVDVQHLGGGLGRLGQQTVDRGEAISRLAIDLAHEAEPVHVRKQQLRTNDQRDLREAVVGAGRGVSQLLQLVLRQVALGPDGLQQNRVALDERVRGE